MSLKSHHRLQPNPTAGPLTAATTGTRHRAILRTSSRPWRIVLARNAGSSPNSASGVNVLRRRKFYHGRSAPRPHLGIVGELVPQRRQPRMQMSLTALRRQAD